MSHLVSNRGKHTASKPSSGAASKRPKRKPQPEPQSSAPAKPLAEASLARKTGLWGTLFLLLLPVYLELLLRATSGMSVFHDGLAGGLFAALAFSAVAAGLCSLPKRTGAAYWLRFAFAELFTVWYTLAYFINDSYKVFMSPSIVFSVAGDAAKDFGGNIVNVLINGLPMILLYHIPVIAYLVLRRLLLPSPRRRKLCACLLLGSAVVCAGAGYLFSVCTPTLKSQLTSEYTYDGAIRNFGLLSALCQSLAGGEAPDVSALAPLPTLTPPPSVSSAEPEQPEASAPVVYGKNVMDIDLDSVRTGGNQQLEAMKDYILSLDGSSKNEYTGIFEGKNLILITAEAFSKEIIDPERTPTLYRLANKGIVFEDFYQPVWGGSTSTGEYSWLMGIAPSSSTAMIYSQYNNLYFTMGNQLQRLGYYSSAYHNGSYTYYKRNDTHPNLGYSQFIGIGNGLQLSGGFPASDLEMIDVTLPEYIDKQPFSIYYMTISGHASYAFSEDVNDISVKNKDITDGMPYSDTVKAYYACNQELEYALESLVSQLEEAGIVDDTVIALVPDHYPYGLMPSSAWGSRNNALNELYGYPADTNPARDHNAAIIWCGSLEEAEPIVVSTPVTSLDMLPTLSNLFGLEFDSRLLVGRDVLAPDTQPFVFWTDYCWLTEKGYYDSHEDSFTPTGGEAQSREEYDADYVDYFKSVVKAKLSFSANIANYDYYALLFGKDDVK